MLQRLQPTGIETMKSPKAIMGLVLLQRPGEKYTGTFSLLTGTIVFTIP